MRSGIRLWRNSVVRIVPPTVSRIFTQLASIFLKEAVSQPADPHSRVDCNCTNNTSLPAGRVDATSTSGFSPPLRDFAMSSAMRKDAILSAGVPGRDARPIGAAETERAATAGGYAGCPHILRQPSPLRRARQECNAGAQTWLPTYRLPATEDFRGSLPEAFQAFRGSGIHFVMDKPVKGAPFAA
jgi:hypothetical protein